MEIWGNFASSNRLSLGGRGTSQRARGRSFTSFQHKENYHNFRRNWPIKTIGMDASEKYDCVLGTADIRPIWAQCVPLDCGSPTAKGAVKTPVSVKHMVQSRAADTREDLTGHRMGQGK